MSEATSRGGISREQAIYSSCRSLRSRRPTLPAALPPNLPLGSVPENQEEHAEHAHTDALIRCHSFVPRAFKDVVQVGQGIALDAHHGNQDEVNGGQNYENSPQGYRPLAVLGLKDYGGPPKVDNDAEANVDTKEGDKVHRVHAVQGRERRKGC